MWTNSSYASTLNTAPAAFTTFHTTTAAISIGVPSRSLTLLGRRAFVPGWSTLPAASLTSGDSTTPVSNVRTRRLTLVVT